MRRLLAISLLLLFSFPLVSPIFALSANTDANLPACCRRNGAHHCHLKMQQASASAGRDAVFATPSKCPFYPGAATLVRHNDAKLHAVAGLHAEAIHHTVVKAHAHAFVRIAFNTAWQKRGPPAQAS